MSSSRLSVLLLIAILLGLSASSDAQFGSSISLSGTVVGDDGKAMEGVAVSARADEKTYTTTVYTDLQGHYTLNGLPAGHYKVWAQAVGFEAGEFEQVLSGPDRSKRDFTLKTASDISTQISGDEMLASLPNESPDDLRMREIFARNCTGCHQAVFPLQNRFDVQGWTAIINFMERTDPFAVIRDPNRVSPVIDAYKPELAAYLAKVRGPSSAPLKYQLVPRPSGEAGQVVITEFDLPFDLPPGDVRDSVVANRGNVWANGEPSDHMPPHDARVDQRGLVWFTDQINPAFTIGSLDPKTGKVSGYKLADEEENSVGAHGLGVDKAGNIWITNSGEGTFSKFDPKTEKFTRFPRPESLPRVGGTLNIDSKGMLWAETPVGAIKLDPANGEYKSFGEITPGSTYGTAIDRQDRFWFSEPGVDRVVVVYPTGEESEVVIPGLKDSLANDKDKQITATQRLGANNATPLQSGPRRMAADENSDFLWIAEYMVDKLARIDTNTREVKEYSLPHRFGLPYTTAVDKNHMVWIALMNSDRVVKFDPSTEKFTEYLLPTRGTEARDITVDDKTDPPTVWVPYYRTRKLARLQFSAVTSKPNAQPRGQ